MAVSEHYRAVREHAGALDRSDRGRLRLTGADRRTWLHGILTNDIASLQPGTGCYTAYLTPQGRMIADMRVFELGDSVLVDVAAGLAQGLRDRWDMLIFSEDVQVTNISPDTAQVGVYGPAAASVLAGTLGGVRQTDEPSPAAGALEGMPLHANARWDFDGRPATVLRSNDLGVAGFDVVVPIELTDLLVARLRSEGAASVDLEVMEVTRIEAGIPKFGADMTEDTIPLEAGIEDRAISLTKGCYVGQEIIIRVLHRGGGRVAKRLVALSFDPGAAVRSAGDRIVAGERDIGAVTSAAWSPAQERPIALGYVHRDFVEPGTAVEVGDPRVPARVSGVSGGSGEDLSPRRNGGNEAPFLRGEKLF